MKINQTDEWPYNFLFAILDEAPEYIPTDLEASIEYVLHTFSEKDAQIIYLRYREHNTFKEIGCKYNISAERVRQIIERTLARIRHSAFLRLLITEGIKVLTIKAICDNSSNIPIEMLGLSVKTFNTLKRANVNTTLRDLIVMDIENYHYGPNHKPIRNLGEEGIQEIITLINIYKRANSLEISGLA